MLLSISIMLTNSVVSVKATDLRRKSTIQGIMELNPLLEK